MGKPNHSPDPGSNEDPIRAEISKYLPIVQNDLKAKEWFDGLNPDQVKAVIEFAARSLDKTPQCAPFP